MVANDNGIVLQRRKASVSLDNGVSAVDDAP
jgi:hypothetical protein